MSSWKYYNHALLPVCAPHEFPDLTDLKSGALWKKYPKAIFARYTTDFDCEEETQWWYVLKDSPFDITTLKSKRRYEINKGKKNFEVKKIKVFDFREQIYNVQKCAFSAYPPKYRPNINKESFIKQIEEWEDYYIIYGAFFRETNELCGYALLKKQTDFYISFNVLKTIPNYERYGINAVLVEKIMRDHEKFLSDGGIICDGERSIYHETKFQDYLEKYFGFRKVYCRLNIKYNSRIGWIIKCLYRFRKILFKIDNIGIMHKINAILKMEEIVRKQNKNG